MNMIPELIPISELRQRQSEVLNQLAKRPVVLTQHGRAAAVLVSPDLWNQLLEELEDLRDALDVVEEQEAGGPTRDYEEYVYQREQSPPTQALRESSEAAWDYYEYLVETLGREWTNDKSTQELIDEIRES